MTAPSFRAGLAAFVAFLALLPPAALATPGEVYYIHTDHLDTPREVRDAQNTVVWKNPPLTEPFGLAPPDEDPDGDGDSFTLNLRFPGQYYDKETNTPYNYFRDHYFPELGRYGQSDPIGLQGGINTYAYVEGNPLTYRDPLGLYTEIIQWGPMSPWYRSPWGHISGNINGKNWSFAPKGWDTSYPTADDYARRQTIPGIDRGGRGVVLDLSPEEEALLEQCLKDFSWYNMIMSNCGNPWMQCLNQLGIIDDQSAWDKARLLPMDIYRIISGSKRSKGTTSYPGARRPIGE
jgi:RHS repeat-associated protein